MFRIGKFSTVNFDWILMGAVLLLSAMGMAAIYSVDLSQGGGAGLFKRQLVALAIGLVVCVFSSLQQPTFFRFSAGWLYCIAVALLLAVLIFGRTIRGTTGWFNVGGFSFQPVEVAKVAVIIFS